MKEPTTDKINKSITRLDQKVRQLNHGLSSVYQTTQLLTGPMELQQVLEIVVRTIAQALGVHAAGLRLLDDSTGELVLKATYGLSEEYKNKGAVTAAESELNEQALHGQAVIVSDMRTDKHFQRYRDAVIREEVISSLSIGLMYKEKGIGILRLYSKTPRQFTEVDISLAQTVASQSAAAIENARLYQEALKGERMARQLRLAGAVQRHLIPERPPQIPGLDLAGLYVPCYDVGGDFYDFITLPDQRLVLAIGDIMGKGVPASLAMASLRSLLRAYAELTDSLEQLICRTNSTFCHDIVSGEFATLFCAILDTKTGLLTYCNCGHEPPILIRNEKVTELSEGGIILGIDKSAPYQTSEIELIPGDTMIMYTDGLADAINFQQEPFTHQRIIKAALACHDMTAEQTAKNILWTMRKFAGLTERFDDTALVVLKKTDQ